MIPEARIDLIFSKDGHEHVRKVGLEEISQQLSRVSGNLTGLVDEAKPIALRGRSTDAIVLPRAHSSEGSITGLDMLRESVGELAVLTGALRALISTVEGRNYDPGSVTQ